MTTQYDLLMKACQDGDFDTVQNILQDSSVLNCYNTYGYDYRNNSAISCAYESKSDNILNFIFKLMAQRSSNIIVTYINCACYTKNLDILNQLVNLQVDYDNDDLSQLISDLNINMEERKINLSMIESLFKIPIILKNINNQNIDRFGETILHWACRDDNPEIIKFLMENGADMYLETYDANGCDFGDMLYEAIYERVPYQNLNALEYADTFYCTENVKVLIQYQKSASMEMVSRHDLHKFMLFNNFTIPGLSAFMNAYQQLQEEKDILNNRFGPDISQIIQQKIYS